MVYLFEIEASKEMSGQVMRIAGLVTILSVFICGAAFAQTQDSYEYHSEFIWGVNKNSSSGLVGGLVFKKSRRLNDYMFETYGLELINVRHPQEVRKTSQGSGNFFIFGKSNYLYAVRLQYGRDVVLFQKAPQQGVEIKGVLAAGPTIGVVAPYYIERSVDGGGLLSVKEQYNPNDINHVYGRILGNGGIFYGIGESKIQMGGNLKAALNFETGVLKSQVTGFEVGFLLDAYFKEIVMVPTAPKNYSVYPTIFLTLFYGNRK
jgi:hypothetical protein